MKALLKLDSVGVTCGELDYLLEGQGRVVDGEEKDAFGMDIDGCKNDGKPNEIFGKLGVT